MKVLHLGKFYPPARGGMETILELICDRTSAAVRNRVLVASHNFTLKEERHGQVEVIRLPAIVKIGAVAVCPTLPFRLAAERADLIVIHEPNPMALLAYFLARPAGAVIVWFHSEVVRPSWRYRLFYRPFLQFALERAARIIVASPSLAASAPQLREWQSKCVVIPYGLESARQHTSDQIAQRASNIRSGESWPIVLFVGRLVRYKGVDVLIEAMRGISASAVIVGDGPERRDLQNRARALGLSDRVKFLGEVSDDELAALYRACDLLVLPSVTRQEAFGLVQLEAMAAGKPVISTDLGTGAGWVNQHGETGLVVAPGDAQALHDAIRQLAADQARRESLGRAGRERARTVFTIDRMIDRALALYRDVVGERVKIGAPARTLTAKRLLDLLLSGTGLVLSSPVWLLIGVLIKIEDGGPVFFAQERVGQRGRQFQALKFRSMIVDAERFGARQSGENDARVTRLGRLLRATAMDELPQLWNIFRGDMSFVGPRALRPGEIEVNGTGTMEPLEEVPGFSARCAVKPGLTGVAQIYASRDVLRRHKFRYDRIYIGRQSLWLDVRLILLSFWITFRGTWESRGRKF
jgi:rhamnosyl/mannosyltransferase